jgi:cytochrome c biogenesis protein
MANIKKFFTSTKSAIALLTITALASIIGTIIPQNAPEHAYINKYGEGVYYFFRLFSITDIYHSFWFIGILVLLSINIIICSINRFSSIRKLFTTHKKEIDEQYILRLPLKNKFDDSKEIDDVYNSLIFRLHKKNYHLKTINHKPTKIIISGEKGKLGKLGSYITHLSILIILLGGIIGGVLGFKEYVEINEKDTIDVPHTDFSLRVDDFDIEFYPNSKMPKDYKSTLTIIDDGRKVLTKTIEVNHPLIYKGVWFYQSSYGIAGVNGVTINLRKKDDNWQKFNVKIGKSFNIPQTNITIKVAQFLPDFAIAEDRIYSRSNELNNPAVELEGYEGKRLKFSRWVFYNFPEYHSKKDVGFEFRLIGFDTTQYTGLQIVKDPGVPVVWVGCGLLMIGLILSFFIFHRRIWVVLKKEGEKTTILIGGLTNKNKFDFEREFSELIGKK